MSAPCVLRDRGGGVLPFEVPRYEASASDVELRLLDLVAPGDGPVLDVGCGPGRLLAALGERGVAGVGVEPAASAAAAARRRGAAVLERSVFERLPGTGRWGVALVVDGNIGIGGDPPALLGRMAELLRPGGRLLVEVDAGVSGVHRSDVRLERGAQSSPWFPWARVGADAIAGLADAGGWALGLGSPWVDGGRCFAEVVRP